MSKVLQCDLHTHTNYSFDSVVTMEQYAEKAAERGIDVVCFTDHIDCNRHYNTFDGFLFEERKSEFERLKKRFAGKVELLLGFEIGEPHLHPDVMQAVYATKPDMIIGSIHFPADYEQREGRYPKREYEQLYNRYVREMVMHGGFDVLGHADMPKKYYTRGTSDSESYVEDLDYIGETLRLCVEKGIIPELNTSSLRNGLTDTMPSLKAIEYYLKCGGKFVTINSDSHDVNDLGRDYGQIFAKLPDKLQTCYFVNRQLKVAKTK
ncbi:MAG: histidinol-phosphatase HisJ family protein [Clostridiales bacterium]|nr:histidinol-phosphatase HisJ family protein [Clostridiales bacterium]